MNMAGQRVLADMRREIFAHVQEPPPVVLRQEPGGAPRHPRDHGRRRAQRAVHVGRRHDLRRRVHAARHHGRARLSRLAPRARHVRGAPGSVRGDAHLQAAGPRGLPKGPHPDRDAERLHPGEHRRDDGGPALRPGRSEVRGVQRSQPAAHRREPGVDPPLRHLLSRRRGAERGRDRAHRLVRRGADPSRDAHAGRAGRLHPVLREVLPSHQRPVGEVQHPSGCDGLLREDLRPARHRARHRYTGGGLASRSGREDSRFVSRTCRSLTRARTGC